MFKEVGRPEAGRLPWSPRAGAACREECRLRVITSVEDCLAGLIIAGMVHLCPHIGQVSVDPGSAPSPDPAGRYPIAPRSRPQPPEFRRSR